MEAEVSFALWYQCGLRKHKGSVKECLLEFPLEHFLLEFQLKTWGTVGIQANRVPPPKGLYFCESHVAMPLLQGLWEKSSAEGKGVTSQFWGSGLPLCLPFLSSVLWLMHLTLHAPATSPIKWPAIYLIALLGELNEVILANIFWGLTTC